MIDMKTFLNVLAVLTAAVVNMVSGTAVMTVGRVHALAISDKDSELPLISQASTAYTATNAPMLVGMFLGVATLVGLSLVIRSKRFHWLLPFLLALSFVVATLHLMFVVFGVTIPLVRIISTMSE